MPAREPWSLRELRPKCAKYATQTLRAVFLPPPLALAWFLEPRSRGQRSRPEGWVVAAAWPVSLFHLGPALRFHVVLSCLLCVQSGSRVWKQLILINFSGLLAISVGGWPPRTSYSTIWLTASRFIFFPSIFSCLDTINWWNSSRPHWIIVMPLF